MKNLFKVKFYLKSLPEFDEPKGVYMSERLTVASFHSGLCLHCPCHFPAFFCGSAEFFPKTLTQGQGEIL